MTRAAVRAVVDAAVKAIPAMIAALIAVRILFTPRRTAIIDSAFKADTAYTLTAIVSAIRAECSDTPLPLTVRADVSRAAVFTFAAGFADAAANGVKPAAGAERKAVAAIIVAVPAEIGAVAAAGFTIIANSGTKLFPIHAQFTNRAEHIGALAAIFAAVAAERHACFVTVRAGAYDTVPAGTVLGLAFAASLANVRAVLAYAAVCAP